jgi:hypothetical protein
MHWPVDVLECLAQIDHMLGMQLPKASKKMETRIVFIVAQQLSWWPFGTKVAPLPGAGDPAGDGPENTN